MSVDEPSDSASKKADYKVHDAAEKTRETIDAAVHDAGETIRGGIDRVKASLENVKDAVSEKLHRGAAEAERTHREIAGDDLTAGERVGSIANEVKNDAQAEIDALKQRARKL
jgi:vacuolar-type H+-ATPase subunit H